MVYPVSCTAVCYVTVTTLFIKKVGVVRPNFWGVRTPPPSGCALVAFRRLSWFSNVLVLEQQAMNVKLKDHVERGRASRVVRAEFTATHH